MKFLAPMGVPLRFHWSTIALPIVLSLVYGIGTGLLLTVLFLFSAIFHEYGHVWVAQRCDAKAKSVRIFALGGVADIVWDPRNYTASREGWIYLGGPIASVVLAGFAAFLWPLYPAPIVTYLFIINLLLVMLNCFPVIPLDGGRVVTAMFATKYPRYKASKISLIIGIALGVPVLGFLLGLKAHLLSFIFFLILVRSVLLFFKENRTIDDFPNENEGL